MKHHPRKKTPTNMKTCIFMGALVILFTSGKLSGQITTESPHILPTTVHVDTETAYSITASPSRLTVSSGEAVSYASPPTETSHPTVTLPFVSEVASITALSPDIDTTSQLTTASLSTHPVFMQLSTHHSIPSLKPISFTASTAVVTSVPLGITHSEMTTTLTTSTNLTESNDLNTGPSAPRSTNTPVPPPTTHQSTTKSVPEEKLGITSLAPIQPTSTQLLMSESPQTPGHLSVAPPKQEEPPQLDVGDEDPAHQGHHPASPLDPILAGLVSIFIVCTAIASVMLFLKFRHRHEHPEFHRLHDLPMDDLLEDTPLSRYTY